MQTYRINKKLYVRSALLSVLTIGICTAAMVLVGQPDTGIKGLVYFILCTIGGISLMTFIYTMVVFFTKTPPLTIDAGGLVDHCFGSNAGSVRWHNITEINGFQRGRYKYVSIGIADVSPLIEQKSVDKRMAFERALKKNKDHISILLNQLEGQPEEIYAAIEEGWKNATGREN